MTRSERRRPAPAGRGAAEAASPGSISVMAVWTGAEQANFQAVIDGFTEPTPTSTSSTRRPATSFRHSLSTAVEGGSPPDIAFVPQPGLIQRLRRPGRAPADRLRAGRPSQANFGESVIDVGTVDGTALRLPLQGGQQVDRTGTTSSAFSDAGVEPAEDWDTFLDERRDHLRLPASPRTRSAAPTGWTLTDLFENIYLRSAGPDKYDQLATHEIPWTDQSVKDALAEMAKIVGDSDNIAGGTDGALQTDFPTSVSERLRRPAQGRPGHRGRLRRRRDHRLDRRTARRGLRRLPVSRRSATRGSVVVGGGDTAVMFKDSPAAQAFIKYLTTPEAAQIWAEKGGFASAEQEPRPERLPGRDHGDDGGCAGRGRGCSASTSPTCSRPSSAAPTARGSSSSSRTSCRTRTTSTGSRSRWRTRPPRRSGTSRADERREHHGGAPGRGRLRRSPSPGLAGASYAIALGFLAPAIFFLGRLGRLPDDPNDHPELLRRPGRSVRRVRLVRQLPEALQRPEHVTAIKNNAIWVGVVPALVTAIGLDLRGPDRARRAGRSPSRRSSSCRWRSRLRRRRHLADHVPAGSRTWAPSTPRSRPSRTFSTDEACSSRRAPATDDLTGSRRRRSRARRAARAPGGDVAPLGLTAHSAGRGARRTPTQAVDPEPLQGGIAGVVWRDFKPGGGTPGEVETEELGHPRRDRRASGRQRQRRSSSTTTEADGTFALRGRRGRRVLRSAIGSATFAQPFDGVAWLGAQLITPSMIIAYIWIWAGFAMVVIAAGLAAIPRDVLEAARTDGASEWQVFRRVTVPLLAPVLTVVFITMLINVLKVFDIVHLGRPGLRAGRRDRDRARDVADVVRRREQLRVRLGDRRLHLRARDPDPAAQHPALPRGRSEWPLAAESVESPRTAAGQCEGSRGRRGSSASSRRRRSRSSS